MKITFSGIGGVGGYYGGLLAGCYEKDPDIRICFVAKGENLKVIRQNGLQIRNLHDTMVVHPTLVTDQPGEIGTTDYLFCTTKSYDLEENIRQLQPIIGPETVIIPLLNGADITDRLRQMLPGQEVWYGCVYIGARLSAPGVVTHFNESERLWFGDPQGDTGRQQELLRLLTRAGIQAICPEDIVYRIWRKFFLISLSATLTSYYNQSIGEVLAFHREDYFRLGAELRQIAAAKGIHLPSGLEEQVISDQQKMPYDSTTSMHTDFKNGKRTELETLTGYVVASGKALHIPTPEYSRMYESLKSRT